MRAASKLWRGLALLFLAALPLLSKAAPLPETQDVVLSDGTEMRLLHFPANGTEALFWLAGERNAGFSAADLELAGALADTGIELWLGDPVSAYLLPPLPSSFDRVPSESMAQLFAWLEGRNRKRLTLMTTGRAARHLLGAAAMWPRSEMPAAILLYPILYDEVVPGEPPRYFPIVSRTRMRLHILQPTQSAGFFWMERLIDRLRAAGSRVSLQWVKGVRDGYFHRTDASDHEREKARELPDEILAGLEKVWTHKDRQ
jgi:hypothetical protein